MLDELRLDLLHHVSEAPGPVILDLSAVRGVDSAGLRLLLQFGKRQRDLQWLAIRRERHAAGFAGQGQPLVRLFDFLVGQDETIRGQREHFRSSHRAEGGFRGLCTGLQDRSLRGVRRDSRANGPGFLILKPGRERLSHSFSTRAQFKVLSILPFLGYNPIRTVIAF